MLHTLLSNSIHVCFIFDNLFFYFLCFWINCIVLFTVCAVLCSVQLTLYLLHTEGLVHLSLWCPNHWQLWHLSGFGMYISTLVTVYSIFILEGIFRVLKLRIYVLVWIILSFFLMEIVNKVTLTHEQRLVFISSRVQRESSRFLITPFNKFRELWGYVFILRL